MMKTQVIKKTLNPQWNELIQFQVAKDVDKKLTARVMNWNQFTDSGKPQYHEIETHITEFMGMCTVDFSQMVDNQKNDLWIPLLDKQGNGTTDRGQIRLEVSYYAE